MNRRDEADAPLEGSDDEGEGSRKRQRHDGEGSQKGAKVSATDLINRGRSGRKKPIFIDARLHPDEVEAVLAKAPSAEVRAAWLKGEAVPGQRPQHRLRVAKTRVPVAEEDGSDWTPPKVPQELYDEGLEWWEACARDGRGGAC